MRGKKFYGIEDGYIVRGRRKERIEDFNDKYSFPGFFSAVMLLTIPGDMMKNYALFFLLIASSWYAVSTRLAATSRDNSHNVKINDRATYYVLMRKYWLAYTFPIMMIYTGMKLAELGLINEGGFFTLMGINAFSVIIANSIMINIRKMFRNK